MKLRMEALYGHPAENETELSFRQGDIVHVDEEEVVTSDWRYGTRNGKVGLVPHVILKPMPVYVGQCLLCSSIFPRSKLVIFLVLILFFLLFFPVFLFFFLPFSSPCRGSSHLRDRP